MQPTAAEAFALCSNSALGFVYIYFNHCSVVAKWIKLRKCEAYLSKRDNLRHHLNSVSCSTSLSEAKLKNYS